MSATQDSLDVGDTYGALLLGTFFSLVVYGLTLHQTYRYARLHPRDYTYIQVLVVLSLIFETLQTVCAMHLNYHALVTNYFNEAALEKTVWSLKLYVLATEFSQIATYSFFIRRLYLIAENFKYVTLSAVVFLVVDVGFSIAITVKVFKLQDPEGFLSTTNSKHQQNSLVHGKFAAATATHLLLTGSLIYALHKVHRVRKERKSVAEYCLLYVVNTGLLVSIFDLLSWILAAVMPGTAWWAGLCLVTVKLYMVTFLSVLNSRRGLAETGLTIFGADSAMVSERNFISRAQRSATAERYNAPQMPERVPARIDIKVATEIEEGDVNDSPSRTSHSSMVIEDGKVVRM